MNQTETVTAHPHHPSRPHHLKVLLPTLERNVFMIIGETETITWNFWSSILPAHGSYGNKLQWPTTK
jgi:hypothetical protein